MDMPSSLRPSNDDFNHGGFFAEPHPWYELWFKFLQLSPSYELARRYRANQGQLAPADELRLPKDFDTVLSLFDEFGDLQRQFFKSWLLGCGLKMFGIKGVKPQSRLIHKAHNKDGAGFEAVAQSLERYFETDWKDQNKPDVMLLAIPLNQPKVQIFKELKFFVDKNISCTRPARLGKYRLRETTIHTSSLNDALRVLSMRTQEPDLKLWELGVKSNISPSYSSALDIKTSRRTVLAWKDFRILEEMTSKKLRIAKHLAENAARGQFPLQSQPKYMVEFNPKEFHSILEDRLNWEREEIKKYQQTGGGTPTSVT